MLLRNAGSSLPRQILCPHACGYEHRHHLGCDTVQRGTNRLKRRTNQLFPPSGRTFTCCYDKHTASVFRVNMYPLLCGAQNVMGAAQQISTKFHGFTSYKQSHFCSMSAEYTKTKLLTSRASNLSTCQKSLLVIVSLFSPYGGGVVRPHSVSLMSCRLSIKPRRRQLLLHPTLHADDRYQVTAFRRTQRPRKERWASWYLTGSMMGGWVGLINLAQDRDKQRAL